MELLSHFVDITSFLCLIFGVYILRFNPRSGLYRVFFVLCVFISISAFLSGRIYSADNENSIRILDSVFSDIVIICWAVNLHFYILLTEKQFKAWQSFLVYIPALIVIIVKSTEFPMVSDFILFGNRWKYVYAAGYYLYMAYSISYAIIDMVLVYRWGVRSRYKKQQMQAKMILSATIPLWIVCIVADYILPHFEFYRLPPFGSVGRIIYAFILWLSFVKFRFMMPQSSILLREIVYNVHEAVLLLSPDLKVMMHNDKLKEFFDPGEGDQEGRYLFDFTEENHEIKNKIVKVIKGEIDCCYCRLNYKNGPGYIITNTYVSRSADKFGDLAGILLVSSENKGLKEFQRIYRLTDRQMEIVDLCLAGYSSAEISEKLSISRRTAESHVFHIYNRLGVNNKVELYNMAEEFNVVSKRNWN